MTEVSAQRSRYERYMASAAWQRQREQYFTRHDRSCRRCGAREGISLHHLTYRRFGGGEYDTDLVPLCSGCHLLVHKYHRRVGGTLAAATRFMVPGLSDPSAAQAFPHPGRGKHIGVRLAAKKLGMKTDELRRLLPKKERQRMTQHRFQTMMKERATAP